MRPYYQDDLVTLYHGDCREVTAWLDADVLVTDPPYGRAWKQGVLRGHHTENLDGIVGDADTRVRDDALAAWGASRPAAVFGDLMLPPPPGTKHLLIYRKPANAGLRGAIGGFRRDAEAIYLIGPGYGSGIGGDSSVLTTGASKVGAGGLGGRSGHPHEKPQDVLERILRAVPAGVVADPFAGSGSTLRAAKNVGRRAVGVEVEERYCDLIAKNLQQECLFV